VFTHIRAANLALQGVLQRSFPVNPLLIIGRVLQTFLDEGLISGPDALWLDTLELDETSRIWEGLKCCYQLSLSWAPQKARHDPASGQGCDLGLTTGLGDAAARGVVVAGGPPLRDVRRNNTAVAGDNAARRPRPCLCCTTKRDETK
jgi:hypothetical protein